MSKRIGKSLVVNGATIVTEAAWNAELDAKHEQLVEWLKAQGLAGVLIRRNENVAWVTGGAVELRVLTPAETGVASLLVTAAGKRYYFTTENEAPRQHDEELGALDFEPVLFPWWADETAAAAAKLAGGPLGPIRRVRGLRWSTFIRCVQHCKRARLNAIDGWARKPRRQRWKRSTRLSLG